MKTAPHSPQKPSHGFRYLSSFTRPGAAFPPCISPPRPTSSATVGSLPISPAKKSLQQRQRQQQQQQQQQGVPQLDGSSLLQDRECDLVFYRTYFRDKPHFNYVTATPRSPVVVSLAIDDKEMIRILVRHAHGSERIEQPMSALSVSWFRKAFGITNHYIISQLCPSTIPVNSLELCRHPDLSHKLEKLEESQVVRCYKFGVYQLLQGQTLEHQGLANPCDSCTGDFLDFLHWLGEPIKLHGWKGYRAGLDINGDTTGEKSIFAYWKSYEIMFHCASFLPFDPRDHQQVERRRFIGNDIVVIIFKENDDDEKFDLSSVGSRQNHIICIVRPVPSPESGRASSYRVAIAVKDEIHNFAPLEFPPVLQRDDASRDMLLQKLICGERAAYRAKAFATQLLRTRDALLRDAIEGHR